MRGHQAGGTALQSPLMGGRQREVRPDRTVSRKTQPTLTKGETTPTTPRNALSQHNHDNLYVMAEAGGTAETLTSVRQQKTTASFRVRDDRPHAMRKKVTGADGGMTGPTTTATANKNRMGTHHRHRPLINEKNAVADAVANQFQCRAAASRAVHATAAPSYTPGMDTSYPTRPFRSHFRAGRGFMPITML